MKAVRRPLQPSRWSRLTNPKVTVNLRGSPREASVFLTLLTCGVGVPRSLATSSLGRSRYLGIDAREGPLGGTRRLLRR